MTERQRSDVDVTFGITKDDALRRLLAAIVGVVRTVAVTTPVGVLSNCPEREVRHWPESPLAAEVPVFGRSSPIGAMKPDFTVYEWMLTGLDADPSRSVYVGNGPSDELGAHAAPGSGP